MVNNNLTELPKRWCFTTTKETMSIFTKWLDKEYNKPTGNRRIGNFYCIDSESKSFSGWMYFAGEQYKRGYQEISFEQFERWVLKKEVKPKETEIILW